MRKVSDRKKKFCKLFSFSQISFKYICVLHKITITISLFVCILKKIINMYACVRMNKFHSEVCIYAYDIC